MSDDQELMSTGDTKCESCGRRRPLVGVTLSGPVHFNVCVQCAVVAIRTGGQTSADLHFPVGPLDPDDAA